MMPVAVEIRSAGICAARPSPIVSSEKVWSASRERHVLLHDADDDAAEQVDRDDHDAGHRVALDELRGAVHRAVEVGLARDLARGAARASSSVIWPAFRSASIAICLPGIASRVKRAATSATRPAPFVMTTNWITTRIRKTTRPTTTLPPTTNEPNAWMTLPASPCSRISRVTLTLIASRKQRRQQQQRRERREVERPRHVHRRDQDHSAPAMLSVISMSSSADGQRHEHHHDDDDDGDRGEQVVCFEQAAARRSSTRRRRSRSATWTAVDARGRAPRVSV